MVKGSVNLPKGFRAQLVKGLIVFVIGFQIFNGLMDREDYPFSMFPMYRGNVNSEEFRLGRTYFVEPNGQRHPVQDWLFSDISFEFRHRVSLFPRDYNLHDEHHKFLRDSVEEYLRALERNPRRKRSRPKFEKVIVVMQEWDHFKQSERNHPTREVLLYEKHLH